MQRPEQLVTNLHESQNIMNFYINGTIVSKLSFFQFLFSKQKYLFSNFYSSSREVCFTNLLNYVASKYSTILHFLELARYLLHLHHGIHNQMLNF